MGDSAVDIHSRFGHNEDPIPWIWLRGMFVTANRGNIIGAGMTFSI